MNLLDAVHDAVKLNPAAPAFLIEGRVITYRNLQTMMHALAREFHNQGIRPGDIVALSMHYRPLHVMAILALARIGAISVPIDLKWNAPKTERMMARFGVVAWITSDDHPAVGSIKTIRIDQLVQIVNMADTPFTDYVADGDTLFRMSLTSGKTGDPKGELLSHAYQLKRIKQTLYDCDRNSRVMPFTLNHPMGMTIAIGILTIGGTLVFSSSYGSKDAFIAMNVCGVTHAFLSPVMAAELLTLAPKEGMVLPTLKHLRLVGGAPSEALLAELFARATPNVFVSYGLTEVGPIAMATPDILEHWPRSAGRIFPWVKLEILDENGYLLPVNTSGEVRVKIDGIPTSYHGDEQTTAQKFRDGWFYTGDIARVTEEGLLFIEGRMDDIVNFGGPKVNLTWVEENLEKHAQVAEAAAFIIEDETGKPKLAVAVVARSDAFSLADLANDMREVLAGSYPTHYVILPKLARNPAGKLLRDEVAAEARRALDEQKAKMH